MLCLLLVQCALIALVFGNQLETLPPGNATHGPSKQRNKHSELSSTLIMIISNGQPRVLLSLWEEDTFWDDKYKEDWCFNDCLLSGDSDDGDDKNQEWYLKATLFCAGEEPTVPYCAMMWEYDPNRHGDHGLHGIHYVYLDFEHKYFTLDHGKKRFPFSSCEDTYGRVELKERVE